MCDGQPYQYNMTHDQRVRMAHKLLGFAVVEMSNESARLELMSGVAAGAGDDVEQRKKEVDEF